jgi:hypothetical protein
MTGYGGTPISVLCMKRAPWSHIVSFLPSKQPFTIPRYTVLICILTLIFGPYWTSSGLILVAHRPASLPSLRTVDFGCRNSPCPHFAIRQRILRIPSHPPALRCYDSSGLGAVLLRPRIWTIVMDSSQNEAFLRAD